MQDQTAASAIDAALKCDWQKAILTNGKILKENPADIDCLNRLGKAYLEIGDCKKAALFFRKVLKIDKYNPIAIKNLDRASNITPSKNPKPANQVQALASVTNFLEEPGKTRLVTLVNIAPPSTLLKQNYADTLILNPKRHTVIVEDTQGNYLGALPDDLGHRLSILIKGGNCYVAIVKSVAKSSLVVFLREVSRTKKFRDTPSFLVSNAADYLSFLREDTGILDESAKNISRDGDESSENQEEETSSSKLHQDEEPET